MPKEPIRKTIGGTLYSTEEATELHVAKQLFVETGDGVPKQHEMDQALYRTSEGSYFLALWNLIRWNESALANELVNEIQPLALGQVVAWVERHAPDKLPVLDQPSADSSRSALTIRIPAHLREYIETISSATAQSSNKVCVTLLENSMRSRSSPVYVPRVQTLMLPNSERALDDFGRAREFSDPRIQRLARMGQDLIAVAMSGKGRLFDYVIWGLNRLANIEHDKEGALLFAQWVAGFHRWTEDDRVAHQAKRGGG